MTRPLKLALSAALLFTPSLAFAQSIPAAPPAPSTTTPSSAPAAPAAPTPEAAAPDATPPAERAAIAPEEGRPEVAFPAATAADEKPAAAPSDGHPGFVVGMSVGYSAPAGSITGSPNDSLSRSFDRQIPLSVQVGANVIPSLFIGVYGTYAFGAVSTELKNVCDRNNADCSNSSVHLGAVLEYRFSPGRQVQPWIGYGIGYETNSLDLKAKYGSQSASVSFSGVELAHLRAGVDFSGSENVVFGPFVDVSFGQYSSAHSEGGGATKDDDVTQTALHHWITLGFRTTFMP